jgi:predicted metal-dependent peptidase
MNREKVAAARLWAANRFPYLATSLFACRFLPVPGCKAIAVDENWRIYIDPDLVEEWSVSELGGFLVHHVGHLLRDHAGRARSLGIDKQTQEDWVLAADAEINDDMGDVQLPGRPVMPSDIGCEDGKLAE